MYLNEIADGKTERMALRRATAAAAAEALSANPHVQDTSTYFASVQSDYTMEIAQRVIDGHVKDLSQSDFEQVSSTLWPPIEHVADCLVILLIIARRPSLSGLLLCSAHCFVLAGELVGDVRHRLTRLGRRAT